MRVVVRWGKRGEMGGRQLDWGGSRWLDGLYESSLRVRRAMRLVVGRGKRGEVGR